MIIEFSLMVPGRLHQEWSIEVDDSTSDEQLLDHIREEMQEGLGDE